MPSEKIAEIQLSIDMALADTINEQQEQIADAEKCMGKMADFLRETYVVQTAMTPEELNKALAHHKAYIKRWEVSDE